MVKNEGVAREGVPPVRKGLKRGPRGENHGEEIRSR